MMEKDQFQLGHDAGVIKAKLDEHDRHFNKLNNSQELVAQRLEDLAAQVQRLGDQAAARDVTVITTAAALEKADNDGFAEYCSHGVDVKQAMHKSRIVFVPVPGPRLKRLATMFGAKCAS